MRRGCIAVTVLALVACGSEPAQNASAPGGVNMAQPAAAPAPPSAPENEAAPANKAPALTLEAEGLRFFDPESGSASPLPFGAEKEQVVKALAASFETPPAADGKMEECGAGPVDEARWANGFVALFQEGRFRGWEVREPGLTTVDGIGIGSSRRALEESQAPEIEESTLGTEFRSGELGGLLSSEAPDAKVTALWAGLTCFFR